MTWFLDGCIVILSVLSGFCFLGSRTTPGATNMNSMLVVPAVFFAILDVLFVIWRLAE